MGITCEINLFKSADVAYKPGDTVRGVVKYSLTAEKLFNKITVSLKGKGRLVENHRNIFNGDIPKRHTYVEDEKLVDVDDVILDNAKGMPTSAGSHEIPFSFILPENLPCSFIFDKSVRGYVVWCKILYYVRIKFERQGFLKLDKRFRKKLTVANVMTPTLPSSPITYKFEQKPFKAFWEKDARITASATVENSVMSPKGNVNINYEVGNASQLDIKEVKIKLTEEIFFKGDWGYPDLTEYKTLSKCTATPIKAGDTQVMALVMDIPEEVATMKHSKLVSKNYFINIVAYPPVPHRKIFFKVPIEIIDNSSYNNVENAQDSPPSYFEAMEEYKKDD